MSILLRVDCVICLPGSLSQKDIMEVLSILEKRGNLEWQDKSKTSCTIVWKTAGQWADTIYAWVKLDLLSSVLIRDDGVAECI